MNGRTKIRNPAVAKRMTRSRVRLVSTVIGASFERNHACIDNRAQSFTRRTRLAMDQQCSSPACDRACADESIAGVVRLAVQEAAVLLLPAARIEIAPQTIESGVDQTRIGKGEE